MATQAAASGIETNLGFILEQVAKEKGIDKKILVETIEAAILKAAQSAFGPTRELEARFNEDTGQVDLFQYMTVVETVGRARARDRASRTPSSTGSRRSSARSSASRSSGAPKTPRRRASRTRSSATCSS